MTPAHLRSRRSRSAQVSADHQAKAWRASATTARTWSAVMAGKVATSPPPAGS